MQHPGAEENDQVPNNKNYDILPKVVPRRKELRRHLDFEVNCHTRIVRARKFLVALAANIRIWVEICLEVVPVDIFSRVCLILPLLDLINDLLIHK